MTIKGKLAAGFLAVALLAAIAGGFGIAASRQIIRTFEGGEKHFRSIVWAATELTSYAQRAEGHLLQYLVLGDSADREKFYLRYAAMKEQLAILRSKISNEEARGILREILAVEGQILNAGTALIEVHEADKSGRKAFHREEHTLLLKRFEKAVNQVENAGLRLAHLETNFLNKQEAITAACDLSSHIKRAETHLMRFLIFGLSRHEEAYLGSCFAVRGEMAHLEERLKTSRSRAILTRIKALEREFSDAARELRQERKSVSGHDRTLDYQRFSAGIRHLNQTASEIRDGGVRIAKLEAEMEKGLKKAAIDQAEAIRRNILLAMVALVAASLIIGFLISRAILVPIQRLKDAVLEVETGNLEARIEATGGDEIGTLAVCFNRMAENLRATLVSIDFVENILQSMMDAVVVLATNLSIQRVNVAICQLSGYTEAELAGRPLGFLLDEADDLLRPILAKGSALRPEVNLRRKDGGQIPVLFSGSVIRSQEGSLTGVVLALRDVSDLRRAEAEKRDLQGQLLHAQKMETIGTLAGGIAHDFNNLLTPILGFSRICRDDAPPASAHANSLDRVIAAAERARELVRQIVTFSRHDDLHRRLVQIDQVVGEAVGLLRAALPKSITLREHIEEGLAALANPTQVHQIVMNLGTNALHAMEENGGTLEIRLESASGDGGAIPQGKFVLLTVRDTGAGMDKPTMGRIFEPFFTTKGVGKGTGLGLAVVHGIVRNHGGEITVESQKGKGTRFRVYFPEAVAVGGDQQAAVPEPKSPACVRILLVDDESAIALLGQKILERLGHRVTIATHPQAALEIFRAEPGEFDLLITDYSMPGTNGIDLARKLKLIRPQLSVVMMTGFGSYKSDEAMNAGIQACLTKPFHAADLERAVRRVLTGEFPQENTLPLLAGSRR